jgi:hypothetical protein
MSFVNFSKGNNGSRYGLILRSFSCSSGFMESDLAHKLTKSIYWIIVNTSTKMKENRLHWNRMEYKSIS